MRPHPAHTKVRAGKTRGSAVASRKRSAKLCGTRGWRTPSERTGSVESEGRVGSANRAKHDELLKRPPAISRRERVESTHLEHGTGKQSKQGGRARRRGTRTADIGAHTTRDATTLRKAGKKRNEEIGHAVGQWNVTLAKARWSSSEHVKATERPRMERALLIASDTGTAAEAIWFGGEPALGREAAQITGVLTLRRESTKTGPSWFVHGAREYWRVRRWEAKKKGRGEKIENARFRAPCARRGVLFSWREEQ
ncbi:hypothetical protein ERJ75_000295400 [Trypanosoma vivax]|nr:hypothetical protein ERJ75_000295400 [Trypanosoma vivax]